MPPQGPRFHSYSAYLRQKYGRSVYRVSVDAGFSCPNRGSAESRCLYCDEGGARAPYLEAAGGGGWRQDLRSQVEHSISFLRSRYSAGAYILYFQAFSGTYAAPERLKEIYDYGLSLASFEELVVSTRPDCIDESRARLLASYSLRGLEVWVELGLQSASDSTLQRINRGHSRADFERAYRLLRGAGIKVAVHLIFGLPGEGLEEILASIRYLAALVPDGLKIHNLHIPLACPLYHEYLMGEICVPSDLRHLEYVIRALELLPPQTVIMRLTCDTAPQRLAAPARFLPKPGFFASLRHELEKRDTWQGRLYRSNPGGLEAG